MTNIDKKRIISIKMELKNHQFYYVLTINTCLIFKYFFLYYMIIIYPKKINKRELSYSIQLNLKNRII